MQYTHLPTSYSLHDDKTSGDHSVGRSFGETINLCLVASSALICAHEMIRTINISRRKYHDRKWQAMFTVAIYKLTDIAQKSLI